MEFVGLALGGIAGVALGIWGGLVWGARLRERPSWRYWAANGVVTMLGMLAAFGGQVLGIGALWVAGLSFMGGGITGLKYGLGKSVGVWRTVDRITGADELPRG